MKGKVLDTEDSQQLIAVCGEYEESKNHYYEKTLLVSFNGDFIQEVYERKEVQGKKKPDVKHEATVLSRDAGIAALKASGFNPENLGLLLSDLQLMRVFIQGEKKCRENVISKREKMSLRN